MRRPLLWLAASWAAVFAVRAALVLVRSGPVLMADEAGYLGSARLLAGGSELMMGSSPFYRSGYSLLLVPVMRLDLDPVASYRLSLLVNAALAASLVPLLYALLRRAFDVTPAPALAAAVAGASYPAVTTLAQAALAENALFPLTVAWLLSIAGLVRASGRAGIGRGVAVGAAAAALWLVHGRMIVVVAVTVVVLAVLPLRARLTRAAGAVGLAVIAIGVIAGRALDGVVRDRNYDGRGVDQLASALDPLDHLDGWVATARNLVGQSWYAVVASFGIVVVLACVELLPSWRSTLGRSTDRRSVVVVALVATTVGLLVLSALWLDAATRPDQLVYGRYVEPTLPPIVAVGVALLARGTPVRTVLRAGLAATVVLTAAVAGLRVGVHVSEGANRWNVASLPFVTGEVGPAIIAGACVVALLGGAALVVTARRAPRLVWVVAVCLFVPIAAFSEVTLVSRSEDATYPDGWSMPRSLVESGGDMVGYDVSHLHNVAVKVYQWHLPRTELATFDGDRERPPAALFFSSSSWPVDHPGLPATKLWRDPARDQVLWKLD